MDKEHQTKPRSSVQLARGAFVGIVFGVLGLYAVMRLTDSHISWTELAQIEPITLIMACGRDIRVLFLPKTWGSLHRNRKGKENKD
jgi:hypothetical protein